MGRGRYKSVITRMDLCGPSIAMLLRSQPLPRVARRLGGPMGGVTPARQPARGQRYILSAIYCFSHFTSEDPNEARWLSPCRCCFDAVGRSNRLHPASPNPKVRAITGLVRLDASAYQK